MVKYKVQKRGSIASQGHRTMKIKDSWNTLSQHTTKQTALKAISKAKAKHKKDFPNLAKQPYYKQNQKYRIKKIDGRK